MNGQTFGLYSFMANWLFDNPGDAFPQPPITSKTFAPRTIIIKQAVNRAATY